MGLSFEADISKHVCSKAYEVQKQIKFSPNTRAGENHVESLVSVR